MTKKEPRDDNQANDISPSKTIDDVMPQLDCDFACENANLMSAETTMSTSDVDDDFQRHSISSPEQQLPTVQPWSNETAK